MIPDLHGFGPALIAGTWMTIQLALASLALGLVLGLLGALAKTSPYVTVRWIGGTYSTIVRGVPELIWVLLIYFGTINLVRGIGTWVGIDDLALSPFVAGTIALGLCFGAYATEVFRGALLAIPKGHREAGLALGLGKPRICLRLVLPQLMPRLLISLRLVLGSAWLFLIAAEAIASTDGLGYRIFLVRRYMAMDVILPYVAWITLLAWAMDYLLRRLTQLLFPWYEGAKA